MVSICVCASRRRVCFVFTVLSVIVLFLLPFAFFLLPSLRRFHKYPLPYPHAAKSPPLPDPPVWWWPTIPPSLCGSYCHEKPAPVSSKRLLDSQDSWILRPKLCVVIMSQSLQDCRSWLVRNSKTLFQSESAFPVEDDFSFRCALDDDDFDTGCFDSSSTPSLSCLRLHGARYYDNTLPAKTFHALAQLSIDQDECRWVFKVDDRVTLRRPLNFILGNSHVSSCSRKCYVGSIPSVQTETESRTGAAAEFWRARMGTSELTPFAKGEFYGFSGDLLEHFRWTFETGMFVKMGREDLWVGMQMLAAGATFCPINKIWSRYG